MTITAAATGTPIQKPNGVFPVVDMQTGCLNEHGLRIFGQYHNFIVGMNRVTPCNASGKNVVTLTPLAASPLIEKYVDFEVFIFVAAQTSDASVTMTVVPKDGTLATLKAYVSGGASQAGSGDLVAGSLYLAIFNDALDANAGGFVVK